MTGNSSWWLLGSAGTAVLLVLVLWGAFGVPLLLCVCAGLGLCALSLAYVFALKNNRPAHYDSDFFESVLVESGAAELTFGPRLRRPSNPFIGLSRGKPESERGAVAGRMSQRSASVAGGGSGHAAPAWNEVPPAAAAPSRAAAKGKDPMPTVPVENYERLQAELTETQSQLEEALTGGEEEFT